MKTGAANKILLIGVLFTSAGALFLSQIRSSPTPVQEVTSMPNSAVLPPPTFGPRQPKPQPRANQAGLTKTAVPVVEAPPSPSTQPSVECLIDGKTYTYKTQAECKEAQEEVESIKRQIELLKQFGDTIKQGPPTNYDAFNTSEFQSEVDALVNQPLELPQFDPESIPKPPDLIDYEPPDKLEYPWVKD